jgi:hypothetical protein
MLKFLNPKVTTLYGFDEVCKMTFKVSTPRNTPISAVYDALREKFSSHCTHDHDCCGCRVYSYSVSKVDPRGFRVRLNVGRNY